MKLLLKLVLKFAFYSWLLVVGLFTVTAAKDEVIEPALYTLLAFAWFPIVVAVGFAYWKKIFGSFKAVSALFLFAGLLEMILTGFHIPLAWKLYVPLFIMKIFIDTMKFHVEENKKDKERWQGFFQGKSDDRVSATFATMRGPQKANRKGKSSRTNNSSDSFFDIHGNPNMGMSHLNTFDNDW